MLNNISHTCIVNATTTTTTKCQPSVVIKNKTKNIYIYSILQMFIHAYTYVVCVCGILNANVCVSFLFAMEMLTAQPSCRLTIYTHTRTYLSTCIYRYILLYTHLYILYLYFYVRWHYNNRYSICNTRTQRTFARKNCEHFVENQKHFTFYCCMIIIYINAVVCISKQQY